MLAPEGTSPAGSTGIEVGYVRRPLSLALFICRFGSHRTVAFGSNIHRWANASISELLSMRTTCMPEREMRLCPAAYGEEEQVALGLRWVKRVHTYHYQGFMTHHRHTSCQTPANITGESTELPQTASIKPTGCLSAVHQDVARFGNAPPGVVSALDHYLGT